MLIISFLRGGKSQKHKDYRSLFILLSASELKNTSESPNHANSADAKSARLICGVKKRKQPHYG